MKELRLIVDNNRMVDNSLFIDFKIIIDLYDIL